MRRRLDDGRREELLDGVMRIIAARGFAGVRTSQMARELHCSETTLYKIAPSKDSLLVLALDRWAPYSFVGGWHKVCNQRITTVRHGHDVAWFAR